jgi:predicted adenine nucleotide alpha hydrolase (AANH) superfamily ATPase
MADSAMEEDPPKSQPTPEILAHIDSHRESELSPEADPPVEEDPPKSQPSPETLARIGCSEVNGNEGSKSQPIPKGRASKFSPAADPPAKEGPPKVQPTLETIACIECGEVKENDGFYKYQWKLRKHGGAICKSCWHSRHLLPLELSTAADPPAKKKPPKSQPAPETLACIDSRQVQEHSPAAGAPMEEYPPKVQSPPETLACFQCAAVKGKEDFYRSQWKLREQGGARCKPCWDTISVLASIPPLEEATFPETLACVDCGIVKEKEGFYRNQWKVRDQGGARCKSCWDQHRLVVEASLIVDSPVEKDSPKSETAPPEKLARIVSGEVDGKERSELEPAPPKTLACIDCGAVKGTEDFYISELKLRGQGGARCKPCWGTHEEKSHRVSEPPPSSFGNALAQLIADNPVIEVPPKVQPVPETLACIDCSLVKGKEGFYKNQWKLRLQGGARCKSCWDIHRVSELSGPKKQPSDDDSNKKSGDPPQTKPLEPLETLACIDCGEVNGKEGFYKSQWKLREQGGARCKPCWDSHLVSEGNNKADTPVEAQPILETLGCLDCGAVKDKDGFFKGQWKLREKGGARCKPCWDIHIRHAEQTKMTEAVGDPLPL